MSVEATLGLGGNLGDPVAGFATALRRLDAHQQAALRKVSSVYRTAPWGNLDQPEFRNIAVMIETALSARELLALCLAIEREGGRERRERWGPRTLDIDILTFGGAVIAEPGLQLPHPRIAERAFVLAPLAEIAPDLTVGVGNLAELWAGIANGDANRDEAETQRLRKLLAA